MLPMQAAKSWFWIPWLLPHVGAVIGAGVYTAMISIHHKESEWEWLKDVKIIIDIKMKYLGLSLNHHRFF